VFWRLLPLFLGCKLAASGVGVRLNEETQGQFGLQTVDLINMNFGKWLGLVVVWLGCGLLARAQVGVYGEYSATQLTGIKCLDPQGACSASGGKVNPSGLMGGVYYDFKTFGPVRLGFDVRGGVERSNKSALTSAGGDNATTQNFLLGGVRGSVKTPISWLRPYMQVSAGWARTDAASYTVLAVPVGTSTTNYQTHLYSNFLQYEVFAGLDIKVLPIMDLRPVELGIGNENGSGGGYSGATSLGVKSIGAGLVFHLPSQ